MSVTSTALTKLTEGPLTPFCQFCQFLTWGSARNSLAFSATLGRSSVVRGGVHERFCDALNELQAFSVARDDKTNDDRTRTPNGGLSLTPAPHTDKLDKRPRDSAEGWGAGDVVGENIHPKSGAGINFQLYRTGEITPENAVQWIRVPSGIGGTCPLTTGGEMHRRGKVTLPEVTRRRTRSHSAPSFKRHKRREVWPAYVQDSFAGEKEDPVVER